MKEPQLTKSPIRSRQYHKARTRRHQVGSIRFKVAIYRVVCFDHRVLLCLGKPTKATGAPRLNSPDFQGLVGASAVAIELR